MFDYLFLSLIAALGGFTQGLSGFGSVLVALPLLALFLPIKTVIPLVCLLAMVINLLLLVQLWPHLEWQRILPLVLGSLPGIPIGVYLLKTVPAWLLELTLGVVLVGFAGHHLALAAPRRRIPSWWAYAAGFLAGCLGGSIGTNGPPVIIYTSWQPGGKEAIKSTLTGYFFTAGLAIVALQGASGLITRQVLGLAAIALPSLVGGVGLGMWCYRRLDGEQYRRVMMVLLLCLGVFLAGKGILWSMAG